MTETNIPTSTVLDLAADAIQMAGWAQGNGGWTGVGTGGLCLEGGIMAATGLRLAHMRQCSAYRAVVEYLSAFVADVDDAFAGEAWYFNDQIAETVDDVLGVLRSA